MIELIGIEKHYRLKNGGRKVVLDNIDAVFPKGRNIGILGLNGSGKSTMIRIIGGAERPNAGRVKKTVSVSWPLGFAPSFSGSLTGTENLRFVARIYDHDIDEVTEFVRDFAELGRYMDEPINTYSSGMRAKLAFGLSMAMDFQVYLIDETLSVGDAAFQAKSKRVFEERAARSSLIVASHHISVMQDYCHAAGVLHDGKFTMFDDLESANEFYTDYIAERAA
ncbi:MAG: ABC transporter ATP-binding protein [Caulobacteraceae bacterium]|nr:ABC transporter ATP-binding protein [Caulobacteraceae bacterium]